MGGYAWVTLSTNDSYSLGALVLAHSLKKVGTNNQLAILVTPGVSASMRDQLATVFNEIITVDVLDSKDEAHLALLKRPELGITFTKLHCWKLTQYEKCVFLDADTLVVRNCDELFEREEFSAAPDVGWPDCFNSGVFVFKPSEETYKQLLQFAVDKGSFDGGDQGLLNSFFSTWATDDIKKHLPFVYNLTSIAFYSYLPAFKQYGSETRIIHFIGPVKPWLQAIDPSTRTVSPSSDSHHLQPLLQHWWDLYIEKVHPSMSTSDASFDFAFGMLHPSDPTPSTHDPSSDTTPAPNDFVPAPSYPEPYTHYIEQDDWRQINLPYQPFQVVSNEGDLLNFTFADFIRENKDSETTPFEGAEPSHSEPPPETDGLIPDEQPGDDNVDEQTEDTPPSNETEQPHDDHYVPPYEPGPFDYHTFVPDEQCINAYLEHKLQEYQPDDNYFSSGPEPQVDTSSEFAEHLLPRFLTIPEDDQRQGSNIHGSNWPPPPPEETVQNHSEGTHDFAEINGYSSNFQKEPTPPPEPQPEPHSIERSQSLSNMIFNVADTSSFAVVNPWKSQPEVNVVETPKKFVMPGLKPLKPKVKSPLILHEFPKYTEFTEVNSAIDYNDPFAPPVDNLGFIEREILRRAKSQKQMIDLVLSQQPHASPSRRQSSGSLLEEMSSECVDLSECKRQAGNQPKTPDAKPSDERLTVPNGSAAEPRKRSKKVSRRSVQKWKPPETSACHDVGAILKKLSDLSIGYASASGNISTKTSIGQQTFLKNGHNDVERSEATDKSARPDVGLNSSSPPVNYQAPQSRITRKPQFNLNFSPDYNLRLGTANNASTPIDKCAPLSFSTTEKTKKRRTRRSKFGPLDFDDVEETAEPEPVPDIVVSAATPINDQVPFSVAISKPLGQLNGTFVVEKGKNREANEPVFSRSNLSSGPTTKVPPRCEKYDSEKSPAEGEIVLNFPASPATKVTPPHEKCAFDKNASENKFVVNFPTDLANEVTPQSTRWDSDNNSTETKISLNVSPAPTTEAAPLDASDRSSEETEIALNVLPSPKAEVRPPHEKYASDTNLAESKIVSNVLADSANEIAPKSTELNSDKGSEVTEIALDILPGPTTEVTPPDASDKRSTEREIAGSATEVTLPNVLNASDKKSSEAKTTLNVSDNSQDAVKFNNSDQNSLASAAADDENLGFTLLSLNDVEEVETPQDNISLPVMNDGALNLHSNLNGSIDHPFKFAASATENAIKTAGDVSLYVFSGKSLLPSDSLEDGNAVSRSEETDISVDCNASDSIQRRHVESDSELITNGLGRFARKADSAPAKPESSTLLDSSTVVQKINSADENPTIKLLNNSTEVVDTGKEEESLATEQSIIASEIVTPGDAQPILSTSDEVSDANISKASSDIAVFSIEDILPKIHVAVAEEQNTISDQSALDISFGIECFESSPPPELNPEAVNFEKTITSCEKVVNESYAVDESCDFKNVNNVFDEKLSSEIIAKSDTTTITSENVRIEDIKAPKGDQQLTLIDQTKCDAVDANTDSEACKTILSSAAPSYAHIAKTVAPVPTSIPSSSSAVPISPVSKKQQNKVKSKNRGLLNFRKKFPPVPSSSGIASASSSQAPEPTVINHVSPTNQYVTRKADKVEVELPSNRYELLEEEAPMTVTQATKKMKKTVQPAPTPRPQLTPPTDHFTGTDAVVHVPNFVLPEPDDNSGIAGAIAQLSLDPQSPQSPSGASAAQADYLRRQSWETGKMDYMGRDSFENIWSKISETIAEPVSEDFVQSDDPEIAHSRPVSLAMILSPHPDLDSIDTLPCDLTTSPGEAAEDDVIFERHPDKTLGLPGILEEMEDELSRPGDGTLTELVSQTSVGLEQVLNEIDETAAKSVLDTCLLSDEIQVVSAIAENKAEVSVKDDVPPISEPSNSELIIKNTLAKGVSELVEDLAKSLGIHETSDEPHAIDGFDIRNVEEASNDLEVNRDVNPSEDTNIKEVKSNDFAANAITSIDDFAETVANLNEDFKKAISNFEETEVDNAIDTTLLDDPDFCSYKDNFKDELMSELYPKELPELLTHISQQGGSDPYNIDIEEDYPNDINDGPSLSDVAIREGMIFQSTSLPIVTEDNSRADDLKPLGDNFLEPSPLIDSGFEVGAYTAGDIAPVEKTEDSNELLGVEDKNGSVNVVYMGTTLSVSDDEEQEASRPTDEIVTQLGSLIVNDDIVVGADVSKTTAVDGNASSVNDEEANPNSTIVLQQDVRINDDGLTQSPGIGETTDIQPVDDLANIIEEVSEAHIKAVGSATPEVVGLSQGYTDLDVGTKSIDSVEEVKLSESIDVPIEVDSGPVSCGTDDDFQSSNEEPPESTHAEKTTPVQNVPTASSVAKSDAVVSASSRPVSFYDDAPSAFAAYKASTKEKPPKQNQAKRQASVEDGKEKKGMITKLLEFVGVVKKKDSVEGPSSIFYDDATKEDPVTSKSSLDDSEARMQTILKETDLTTIPDPTPVVKKEKKRSPSPRLTLKSEAQCSVTASTPESPDNQEKVIDPNRLTVDDTILQTPPAGEKKTPISHEIEIVALSDNESPRLECAVGAIEPLPENLVCTNTNNFTSVSKTDERAETEELIISDENTSEDTPLETLSTKLVISQPLGRDHRDNAIAVITEVSQQPVIDLENEKDKLSEVDNVIPEVSQPTAHELENEKDILKESNNVQVITQASEQTVNELENEGKLRESNNAIDLENERSKLKVSFMADDPNPDIKAQGEGQIKKSYLTVEDSDEVESSKQSDSEGAYSSALTSDRTDSIKGEGVLDREEILTELDSIILKAKLIAEDQLDGGPETAYANIVKSVVIDEPVPISSDFEELRVTTDDDRKKVKDKPTSSKLAGQILKAIPPPRRKPISDARKVEGQTVEVVLEKPLTVAATETQSGNLDDSGESPVHLGDGSSPPVPPRRRNRSKQRGEPLPPPKRKVKK